MPDARTGLRVSTRSADRPAMQLLVLTGIMAGAVSRHAWSDDMPAMQPVRPIILSRFKVASSLARAERQHDSGHQEQPLEPSVCQELSCPKARAVCAMIGGYVGFRNNIMCVMLRLHWQLLAISRRYPASISRLAIPTRTLVRGLGFGSCCVAWCGVCNNAAVCC